MRTVTALVIICGLTACGGIDEAGEKGEQVIDQRTPLSCARGATYHGTYHLAADKDTCPAGVTLPHWQDRVVVEKTVCQGGSDTHKEDTTLASNCIRTCTWVSRAIADTRDRVKGTLTCTLDCKSPSASGANPALVGKTCTYQATYVGDTPSEPPRD